LIVLKDKLILIRLYMYNHCYKNTDQRWFK